MQQVDMLH